MGRYLIIGLLFTIIVSCKKNVSEVQQTSNSKFQISSGFELKGQLENFYPKKVYLNKIIENSIYPIDSSEVINNNFSLKGIVKYPERFALTFENYSSISIFIIENVPFSLFLSSDAINDPLIKGSPLNNKLYEYKIRSKQIFKKIDYLFPQFQKARLENNAKKLDEIELKMKKIEIEYTNYSYNFISENSNSYVAAMILKDLLKSTTVDTLRIKETYHMLSSEVKKSPDSQIIASFLNLH